MKKDIAGDPEYVRRTLGLRILKEPPMTDDNDNLRFYKRHAQPPKDALKSIGAGRLKGKTDISPQWRIEAMTEMFGPIGTGWKYEILDRRTETAPSGEVALFVTVALCYRSSKDFAGNGWSEPVIGTGGSMLIAQERNGMHMSDEAEKMAVTDALSVCMKLIGIASDIYRGKFDGSKYSDEPEPGRQKRQAASADRDRVLGEIGGKMKALGLKPEDIHDLTEEAGLGKVDSRTASKETLDKILALLEREEEMRKAKV